MRESNIEDFKRLYTTFREEGKLEERVKQSRIAPVLKEVISATLDNDPLTNEHLTGLIQMTGYGPKIKTFEKYLNANVKDQEQKDSIFRRFNEIGKTGYTGKGLNAIRKLQPEQLQRIKMFLKEAFSVKTVEQAAKLTKEFDELIIPQVKAGIYSPWLHYINPEIFPIINNSTLEFREWMGLPKDYPSFVKAANELKELVGETDHGMIDWFAHTFKKEEIESLTNLFHLNGRKLFKISHGAFLNIGVFKKAGILKVLEENRWISMGNDTGFKQFDTFSAKERMGDYVYICYGGNSVYALGQIVSELKSLNNEIQIDFPNDEEWSYREIKILYNAKDPSVTELKEEKKNYMPSGNSTFWEVPPESIDDLNDKIFVPKFGVKVLPDKDSINGPVDPATTFSELMEKLIALLRNDKSILKDFLFQKLKKDYVWIIDHKKIIGGKNAHYEIIKRKENIYIELHLEGKVPEKNKIISGLKSLPYGIEWFKWDKSESLRLSESFKMSDKTILNNLRNGLLKLEDGIGDKVRELLLTINPPTKKETIVVNQILFGPPGTGKTYNTINHAVAIANPAFDISRPREEVKDEFDRLLDLGQIVFTTFHQSMSYEDFVEGIKPLEPRKEDSPVNYKVIDGIFKKTALYALFEIFQKQKGDEVSKAENFESLYQEFCDYIKDEIEENGPINLKTLKKGNPLRVTRVDDNGIILMGHLKKTQSDEWEETTKTPETLKKLFDRYDNIGELESIHALKEIGVRSWRSGYAAIFKFLKDFEKNHYSRKSRQSILSYSTVKEITRNYIPPIITDPGDYKNYVIIIDEINRGNVAAILGELITLIEEDKRLGCNEALAITLPYSKEKFGVPKNLYLIGTMNTADRSVEALDTALRRRFSFTEMAPLYDLEGLEYKFAGFSGSEILKKINIRIEKLLDKDHLIGHSYFLKKEDQPEEEKLIETFYKNIIPLLQEYFFGDYGKIGLVLGKGFVSLKEWEKLEEIFAESSDESGADFEDKPVYRIIDYRDPAHGFKLKTKNNPEIEMTFEKAIKILMRQPVE